MPTFVRWKWEEKTKTFLVVFYFYDDFSKRNLRLKMVEVDSKGRIPCIDFTASDTSDKQPVMTWAPSHYEIALLADILQYANIINGLKEEKKRKLMHNLLIESPWDLSAELQKKILFGLDENGEPFMAVELCPEYIEYLKKILKSLLD